MFEKTARKYLSLGKLPSQSRRERTWRTRGDPFEAVWTEVEGMLQNSPAIEGKTLFDYLCRRYEGDFQEGQVRTLQRRIKAWRALHGEPQEVIFPQSYVPAHQAQSDFTDMRQLGVRIQGEVFDHLFYHFVLAYSNWETGTICFSESFESLSSGLQNALWELGGVPREHRTDSLSAAVNNLKDREEFTERYQGLLKHYDLSASHGRAGEAHDNGDVEQSHHRFKRAVEQELILRGSQDFCRRPEYEAFLRAILRRRNASRGPKLQEELARLRRLPGRRLEDWTRERVKVTRHSTIRVRNNVYSVHSRLIGERVEVRVHTEHLEVYYGGQQVEQMPRLRGKRKHKINYRHVIYSLVRKPGAFARYQYREDLFPSVLFRVAYDELRQDCPQTADRQYLKILQMAAEVSQSRVESILRELIQGGERIREEQVREWIETSQCTPEKWEVEVDPVEVAVYDSLLEQAQEMRL